MTETPASTTASIAAPEKASLLSRFATACCSDAGYRIALVAILAMAVYLRLDRLELMEFKRDEVENIWLASRVGADGEFLKAGTMSSVGVRNGPLSIYPFAIVAHFTTNPLWFVLLPVLLGVAAVAITGRIGTACFGKVPGLAPAAFLASCPWAVVYSRKIWAQDLLPCFSALALWCALRWLREGRARDAILFGVLTSILVQIHYSAFAFVVFAIVLFAHQPRLWRAWCVAACVAALVAAPFLTYLVETGFADLRVAASRMGSGESSASMTTTWINAIQSSWHGGFTAYFGGALPDETPWGRIGAVIASGVAVIGFFAMILDPRTQAPTRILAFAWPLGILVIGLISRASNIHYFALLVPLPAICQASAIDAMARRGWRVASIVLAVLIVLEGAFFIHRFHDDIDRNDGAPLEYGVSYQHKERVAPVLAALSREAPTFFVSPDGRAIDQGYWYVAGRFGGVVTLRGEATRRIELAEWPSDPPREGDLVIGSVRMRLMADTPGSAAPRVR